MGKPSSGVVTVQAPSAVTASTLISPAGASAVTRLVTITVLGPSARTSRAAATASACGGDGAFGDEFQFELVGGDDIGQRNGGADHHLGNVGGDEDAAPDVAHHRVAAVERPWVGFAHGFERGGDLADDGGGAHVAREHGAAGGEHAARRRCLSSVRRRWRRRTPGRSMRRSRYGWRTARCGSARPRGPSAAGGTPRRRCRHGRRRHGTGWKECSSGRPFTRRGHFRESAHLATIGAWIKVRELHIFLGVYPQGFGGIFHGRHRSPRAAACSTCPVPTAAPWRRRSRCPPTG